MKRVAAELFSLATAAREDEAPLLPCRPTIACTHIETAGLLTCGLDVHAETVAVAVAGSDGEVRSLGMNPESS
jgi:hypothetical protein